MPHIDLPSHRLHYRIDGHAGPWLVFCNSLGADLTMWDGLVVDLSDRFRILRYDRRGHGGSGAPAGPYAMDDLGGDVLALMDALEIDRAHFCGLSIGGLTGQWLALNAPERFDRVALCATAARIGSAESWRDRIEAVRVNGLASMTGATRERWFSPEFAARNPAAVDAILDRFAATDAEGYAGCCAALARADFRDALGNISNPVLAVAGADDAVCPPADLATIADNVQDGKLCVLPGRHIVNVESATAFNDALIAFLSQD
ncbi:3-oxoadipate enol-lactonase [Martelella mediterranea]|uniref:3-oxoadipate enol-lactonase 2 n=1 Tax=Martelella mediterranea DSM 17316 TaxID=1122214 RepID=A0A1U9YWE6_9HYPH|nr:3-oxoadipate enol-lactonase [Martelella mediterranea]AQZ49768.1 3-oxoadipate enol-lactonase 2 [Martelella mediterranea DSM 17316]